MFGKKITRSVWGALHRLDRVPERRALKDECSGGLREPRVEGVEFQAESIA